MTTFLMVCGGILMLSASFAFGGIGLWLGMKGMTSFDDAVERRRVKPSETKKETRDDE